MIKDSLKKEYIDKMKLELKDKFQLYIDALEQSETNGFTLNMKKLSHSSVDFDFIINLFKGNYVYKNDNFAYIIYDKKKLEQDGIYVGKHPFHHAGLYYIQEPSASKVICELDIKKDDAVIDLCASPGGKSIEILYQLGEEGFLISNDVDKARAKTLQYNIERMGFDNVIVTNTSSDILRKKFKEYFDIVLVDAPCSGEGMMRKSEMARKQWSESLVLAMSKIQKKLLIDAYDLLKPGGKLVYSTCTFSKEEDENNVEYILSEKNDLKLIKTEKLYPHEVYGEGQFYAILCKNGSEVRNVSKFPDKKIFNDVNLLKYKYDMTETIGNVTKPTHHITHIDKINFDYSVDLNDDEIDKFLKGCELAKNIDIPNGFVKITYKNLGIGLAKYVSGKLKNHYPKGLRNL